MTTTRTGGIAGLLVLHGLPRANGDLALWAEDASRATAKLPAGRAAKGLAAHPFGLNGPELADRLPIGSADELVEQFSVLLPSYASAPVRSPELVGGRASRGTVRLRAWLVSTVCLPPTLALDLLERLVGLPDVRFGASLRYVVEVVELARELVGAGRVLPRVVIEPDGPAARWRLAPSTVDSARLAALRDAMPPACRAEMLDGDGGQGRTPAGVLRVLLDGLVDAATRTRLASRSVRLAPERAEPTVAAWLTALVGDARFTGDPARVRELAARLETWQLGGQGTVRTCFRLRAPDQVADLPLHRADSDSWRLEFLLQATDEPSVLVPADRVWRDGGGVLRRWSDEPEDELLAGLGRASRLFPDLETALRQAHPTELELNVDDAHRFLLVAPALDQAGFGVLMPANWRRPTELGLALNVATRADIGGSVAGEESVDRRALVDYHWRLALGDTRLTSAELAELASAKVPLVRMRGQWVHVDHERLAAALAFLDRAGSGQLPAGVVLSRAGALGSDEDGALPLPISSVSGTGWLGDLLSGHAHERLTPVGPPAGFVGTLRPYQQRGLAWLRFLDRLGVGAVLADDMGLGKTVQLLALEALVRAEGRRAPTLLVCPMSVVGNWQREAARFTPGLTVHVHHGADRLAGTALADAADLVLTTYAVAARDHAELAAVAWDRVVLDEAQHVKNSAAQQARAVRALPARHRIALTGTPVENRLAELWSIMDFVNPGLLGSLETFRARFAVPVERHHDDEAADRLRRITGPFVLRRLKTDPNVLTDLPEKQEMRQLCGLTAEQATLYQAVLDDMLAKIADSEGIQRKGLVLATMTKLKQVCNHPAQLLADGSSLAGRSGKLDRLEEIIETALADGDKLLCFTQFAEFGALLVPHLSARFDTEVLFLHGGTGRAERDRMVAAFQHKDGPSIFLLSLRAGGTGLNLTAANQVVHLDRWWNPAVEDQATDRAFRIGQRRDVQVRKLICLGTLEEKIDKLIERKKALAELVVGAGEQWLTELSTSAFRELVTLSPEAVGE